MTIHAWPALRYPMEVDMWPEFFQIVNGEDSEAGMIEVITRYSRNRAIVTWNTMALADALAIEAHLARLRGRTNLTMVPHEKYRAKVGTATGSWTVNGAHLADVNSIAVTAGSGTLAAGDWVHIEQTTGRPRAYLVVNYSAGVMGIAPSLQENVSTGKTVNHLGDGTTTRILDTMELVVQIGPALAFPSPLPGLVGERSVEFVSARRTAF